MSETKHSTSPAAYASRDDFQRVFHEETDSLYRLAFLLTADSEKAQQCFVSGLEDSVNGSSVFKEWAATAQARESELCFRRKFQPGQRTVRSCGCYRSTLDLLIGRTAEPLNVGRALWCALSPALLHIAGRPGASCAPPDSLVISRRSD